MIYLDYNASAPVRPEARAAWLSAQDEDWGNPGSIHGQGQRARHRLDHAKAQLAGELGCKAHELVITSGGTEANATAIHAALAGAGDDQGAEAEIVASAIDHSSVLRNIQARMPLHPRARTRTLPVDSCGRLAAATLAAAVSSVTRLVCFQFANNETGTQQEVPALVAAVRATNPHTLVLLDCCQGAGKRPLELRDLGVDFASIAGHKFGAPKGVGALYVRSGVKLPPMISGGRQQQDRRSGTEDPALAAALAAALVAANASWAAEDVRQRALLDRAWERISTTSPGARWIARDALRLANTLSLGHAGGTREHLVTRLDLAGFAVSTGAACMAARGDPSHVIAALGIDPALARSVIRVSIGPGTSADDMDAFSAAYAREVAALAAN